MKKLIAIIPARECDLFLKDKNILPFRGSTLLEFKINQLKSVPSIEEIIVSSDSKEYLEIAINCGVSTDRRPDDLSQLDSDFGNFVSYIASKSECIHILWAPAITPFILASDYNLLISSYFKALNKGYDSLITVNRLRRNVLDDNGPLNFNFSKPSFNDFPNIYEFVNGVAIAPRLDMLKWKYNWGINPKRYELSKLKSFDICTEEDYQMAKELASLIDE